MVLVGGAGRLPCVAGGAAGRRRRGSYFVLRGAAASRQVAWEGKSSAPPSGALRSPSETRAEGRSSAAPRRACPPPPGSDLSCALVYVWRTWGYMTRFLPLYVDWPLFLVLPSVGTDSPSMPEL